MPTMKGEDNVFPKMEVMGNFVHLVSVWFANDSVSFLAY